MPHSGTSAVLRLRALLAVAVLLACAVGGAGAADAPRHVLRFADGEDVQHLDPLLITTYPEAYPEQLTGAFLVRLDARAQPVPELATVVPSLANHGISADGRTITYHLRPDLKWSDGAPLTAADVVFTTKRIIAPDTPVVSTTGWDRIAEVASPNPRDVVFRLKASYGPAIATFFTSGANYSYGILPQHLLADVRDLRKAAFNELPIGAGPFRYTFFKHGDQVVMDANPFYFRGRPKLDRIIYVFLPDENTVTTQLLTGEIDLALRMQPTQAERVSGRSDIGFVRRPSVNTSFLGFNTQAAPFDDVRVRRALRLGLDRTRLLAVIYHGAGSVSDDPVSLLDPFFGGGVPAEAADRARAGALLDAAGWRMGADGKRTRGGKTLAVDLVDQTGNEIAARIAENVRAQWEPLGVTVATRTVSGDVLFAQGGIAARGAYQAMLYGDGELSAFLQDDYACAAIPPHGANYPRYCNAAFDRLVGAADRSNDPSFRTRSYLAARRILATDVPTIPLIHREDEDAVRANVVGFRPNGATIFDDAMELDVRK